MTLEAPRSAPPGRQLEDLIANVERVLLGKREAVTLAVIGLLAEGHVLLEDVPGTGKTTLARALARSLELDFRRVQFTSDLLPSDVLGLSIQNPRTGEFHFQTGPIFTNVVLADELNRTPPRVQSALLEAMNSGSVSIEGVHRDLPRPFLVIATQNPLEFEGTYPLPESQLDRFLVRVRIGYPSRDTERAVLAARAEGDPLDTLAPVLRADDVRALIATRRAVRLEPALVDYLLVIVAATRAGEDFLLGASPRAALALQRAAQSLALIEGRDYCVPDDVKRLAVPVLAHRLVPSERLVHGAEGERGAEALLASRLEQLPVPE